MAEFDYNESRKRLIAVSVKHEVKAKLSRTTNGGTINPMLRASNDAVRGFIAQGSFYSVEIHDPVEIPLAARRSRHELFVRLLSGFTTND